jgi:methyl-accepting chemotaxis protein
VTSLRESEQAVHRLGEHLETAASAVEELSSSIGEIARAATQATDVTTRGVDDAEATTSAVRELDEASAAVGDVVRTITAIAEQTNILALNATIEAARAGEAGRGFAVVAGEVKQLARDTATATSDIDNRIGAIRSSVEGVARAIETIATTLREVNELQSTVAATVEEQRVATDQLAHSVNDAAASSREFIDSRAEA